MGKRHLEFYVLWNDHTWTVEGIKVEQQDRGGVDADIGCAALELAERLGQYQRFETVGPVYFVGDPS